MGDRQSMVVLSRGDWVRVGNKVLQVRAIHNDHVFFTDVFGFRLAHECTKLPEELYPILSDSILNGEGTWLN